MAKAVGHFYFDTQVWLCHIAETMSEQATDKPTLYQTIEEHVAKLQKYLTNAENSLKQLETNINAATNQIQEAKKMQFAVLGQRDLIKSLLNDLLTAPETKTDKA